MKCSHDNEAEKLLSRLHFMTNTTNREGNKNAYCPRNTNHLTGALSKWIKKMASVLVYLIRCHKTTGILGSAKKCNPLEQLAFGVCLARN